MKQVLLDTDVILDLYLDREPFADDAAALWGAHEAGHLTAYISAITPVNLFYVARKLKGRKMAGQAVTELLAALPVCPVDSAVLKAGLAAAFKDFEDAVQHASAVAVGLEGIITRNVADYQQASLPVYTPSDYLSQFPVPSQNT
jgi:predicted nucleic acid-binding protein